MGKKHTVQVSREREGLNRTHLARLAEVSARTIARIERDEGIVTDVTKRKVVNGFNARANKLREYTYEYLFPFASPKRDTLEDQPTETTVEDIHLKQQRLLAEVRGILSSITDPGEALSVILKTASEFVRADLGMIFLYDEKNKTLVPQSLFGVTQEKVREIQLEIEQGVVGGVFARQKSVIIDDVHSSADYFEYVSSIRSEIAVPIIDGPNVVGVLNLESKFPNAFSYDDEAFLISLASLVAQALREESRTPQPGLPLNIDLWVDPGMASADDLRELFDSLAELHRALGGFGITILDDATKVFIAEEIAS